MAGNRKYAGLPDLDIAPDIYETPELTDDASTQQNSTTLRTESRTSSYKDVDEEINGINRSSLNPDEARTHFLPSQIDARDVDFSDRISSRKKSYRASSRRQRKGTFDDGELGDFSDEEDESLERKLARLRREIEEAKIELENRAAGKKHDAEQRPTPDTDSNEESLNDLSTVLDGLSTSNLSSEPSGASSRLVKKLASAHPLPKPPPTTINGTSSSSQPPTSSPSYTITYAPTYNTNHTLAHITSFDSRLTLLEYLLGLSSLPLPTTTTSNPTAKPILPTLHTLSQQLGLLTTISSSSASSSTLEAATRRIRQLTQDASALAEARRAAKEASLTNDRGSADGRGLSPRESTAFNPTSSTASAAPPLSLSDDPEHLSKINALFGTLPTIESLSPLLPSVLDRLRSLRLIHAEAAGAGQALSDVEARMKQMEEEVKEWKAGLEKVEGVMREGEARVTGNMEVVEGWVKELEGRMRRLGG